MKKNGDKVNLALLGLEKGEVEEKNFVIYFYPRDNTPGCTVEACEFRDYNKDIQSLGYKVIGVSKDSQKSHDKFTEKFDLNFTLISDEDKEIINEFGVLKEKKMFGKSYMGIQRSTFIVDTSGKIIHVWPKVKAKDHAEGVYEFLKGL